MYTLLVEQFGLFYNKRRLAILLAMGIAPTYSQRNYVVRDLAIEVNEWVKVREKEELNLR